MQINAKLIQLLPLQTGTGKNGEWRKQDFIVETEAQFPKKICLNVWGDKINMSSFPIGAKLDISFDVESREYNGKWYTDCRAWKINLASEANNNNNFAANQAPAHTSASAANFELQNDDLPF